jgi:hypothetical protein
MEAILCETRVERVRWRICRMRGPVRRPTCRILTLDIAESWGLLRVELRVIGVGMVEKPWSRRHGEIDPGV